MNDRAQDEGDLVWFFCWAPGEMGLHSNYEAMRKQLEAGVHCGGGKPIMELDERYLDAATRARPVLKALIAAGEGTEKVLRLAFGEEHPKGLEAFGRCASLVLASPLARRAHRESCTTRSFDDWMRRLSKRFVNRSSANPAADKVLIREISVDAELLLERCIRRYAAERKRVPMRGAL